MRKAPTCPSAMISFTQIGWFGVGLAMFAIPVSKELLGGSDAAMWGLVILAGVCMTAIRLFWNRFSDHCQLYCSAAGCSSWYSGYGHGCDIREMEPSSISLRVSSGSLERQSAAPGWWSAPSYPAERPHRTLPVSQRMARSARSQRWLHFFIGNSLMFFFGAVVLDLCRGK